jgi:GT2 family glycosyltransferase
MVGVVVIGRNEGQRLVRCLESLMGQVETVVYVDSGSADGSVAAARAAGAEVVELDMSRPFTMARGRNTGFEWLRHVRPDVELVQFVDGDCEVQPGWIELARETLEKRPDVAAVCGRRRERHPEASAYNRLCDLEWNTASGEVRSFGGDVMVRAKAFEEAGAFNPAMIAGEEGDLSFRIRELGWKILRLPDDMTLHDAAIVSFKQYFKRHVRTGHAYAEGASLHAGSWERYQVRPLRSAVVFGLVCPTLLVALAGLSAVSWWFALMIVPVAGAMALVVARSMRARMKLGDSPRHAALYGAWLLPAKLAQAIGAVQFRVNRMRGRRSRLIEYKAAVAAAAKPVAVGADTDVVR